MNEGLRMRDERYGHFPPLAAGPLFEALPRLILAYERALGRPQVPGPPSETSDSSEISSDCDSMEESLDEDSDVSSSDCDIMEESPDEDTEEAKFD